MAKRGGFPGGMGGFGGMNMNNLMRQAKKNARRNGKIARRIRIKRV